MARVTSLQLQCWKSLLSTSLTIQPIIQPDILATNCRNIVFLKNTIDNIQIFNPVVDQPTRKIPLKYGEIVYRRPNIHKEMLPSKGYIMKKKKPFTEDLHLLYI